MSTVQLGELIGSPPTDFNGNFNTLAEGKARTVQFLVFQVSSEPSTVCQT